MARFVILLTLLSSVFQLSAQQYEAAFGKMSDNDIRAALQMTSYKNDTSAEAVVLYERGSIDRTYERTHITLLRRVKIFKNSAANKWGNMSRLVDQRGTREVRGNCYTLVDGKVVKRELSQDNIFKVPGRRGLDEIRTAMPGVVEGSVVEYEFEVNLLKFYSRPGWTFQYEIPVVKSEYFVSGAFSFQADIGGVKKPEYEFNKWKSTHHWWLTDVPAFRVEPLMPDAESYRITLNSFYPADPWSEQVPRIWKLESFGKVIRDEHNLPKGLENVVSDIPDAKARVKKVVEYVKQQMAWNEDDDIDAPFLDVSLEKKSGTSADLNLYLISMLDKANVDVSPVLISTRDHGVHHEHFQTLEQFNYVLAQVRIGKDTLYLDATDRTLPFDVLPKRCLNERGMMLLTDNVKWVNILPKIRSRVVTESELSIDENGLLSGKILRKSEGYKAHDWRKARSVDEKKFVEAALDRTWTVESSELSNADNVDLPFIVNYTVTTDHHVTVAGDMMYVTPITNNESIDAFKGTTRVFPIDFTVPLEELIIFNLNIPEGYAVEQLPESKVISMPGNAAKAIFNFSGTPKQVQILSRLMINRTLYSPNEFAALKDFFQRAAAKQAEQIVLKKI